MLRTSSVSAARMVPQAARLTPAVGLRLYSSQPDPKTKAQSLIDSLPGNSAISKSGILATGFAGASYAIANSLYVVNPETVLLACFAGVIAVMSKTVAPSYKQWAEGYIGNIKEQLNKAREEHVVAVQDRIDNVEKLSDVTSTTKSLFAVSKETVALEAESFERKQQVDFAARAKEVLDSWVRYEASVRQREQQDLVKTVISKIEKAIETDKFQNDVLKQAVTDVEEVFKKA